MDIFKRNRTKESKVMPEALKPVDPVNYNSVLDYLVGLSPDDYKKMTKSADIYRKANKDVANILDVEDKPTTQLIEPKPTDDELDEALDEVLDNPLAFIEDGPESPKPAKEQASTKKIDVSETTES